jgi:hypothetical protein
LATAGQKKKKKTKNSVFFQQERVNGIIRYACVLTAGQFGRAGCVQVLKKKKKKGTPGGGGGGSHPVTRCSFA